MASQQDMIRALMTPPPMSDSDKAAAFQQLQSKYNTPSQYPITNSDLSNLQTQIPISSSSGANVGPMNLQRSPNQILGTQMDIANQLPNSQSSVPYIQGGINPGDLTNVMQQYMAGGR